MVEPFRAGDVVQHKPSGEKWLLIIDEQDGTVVPGGWPDTRANAADCTIVNRADDAKRIATLRSTAASGHSSSWIAQKQLKALGEVAHG